MRFYIIIDLKRILLWNFIVPHTLTPLDSEKRYYELFLLRHGLAGQHGDPKYKDDSLRPLTAEGREKMHRVALGMQTLGLKFDAVISSPYLRAKQTAEIVTRAYKLKNKGIYLTDNLLPPLLLKNCCRKSMLISQNPKIFYWSGMSRI